ncbi:MAG: DUF5362 family protein [Verrucomicrobiota bacterium]
MAAILVVISGGTMFATGAAGGSSPAFTGPMTIGMGIAYGVFAFFYLFPSLKLWKYGSHIKNFVDSQSINDLEAALDAQRSFWKFVGIMVLLVIAMYILLIVGVAFFAGFAAVNGTTP